MSNSVFKVGDVVYHAELGKGTVRKKDRTNIPYYFDPEDGELEKDWVTEKVLSFSPWPAPDHKRPIQDGWWVVAIEGYPDDPCVRFVKGKDVFTHPNRCTRDTSQYEFIRYLGKDWRAEE